MGKRITPKPCAIAKGIGGGFPIGAFLLDKKQQNQCHLDHTDQHLEVIHWRWQ